MQSKRVATVLSILIGSLSCGSETIVHEVDEREANKIIEILADREIMATKGMVDTGRKVYFTISVPTSNKLPAIKLLNNYQLPTPKDMGYTEVFGGADSGGLIPTNAEERAKTLQALEGEIQKQLKLIEGILDVQVQIVMPEEDALRTTQEQISPTTASVTIKYMPGTGGSKPLSEPQVQAIVAAGVEKLTPDKVVVVMTPGGGTTRKAAADRRATETRRSGKGFWSQPIKRLNIIGIAVLGFVLFLCLGLIYAQLRLRSVRSRLIRLQTEIAKARRKEGSSVG